MRLNDAVISVEVIKSCLRYIMKSLHISFNLLDMCKAILNIELKDENKIEQIFTYI